MIRHGKYIIGLILVRSVLVLTLCAENYGLRLREIDLLVGESANEQFRLQGALSLAASETSRDDSFALTGSLELQFRGATPKAQDSILQEYEEWIAGEAAGLLDVTPAHLSLNGDLDGDGHSNFKEFVFGGRARIGSEEGENFMELYFHSGIAGLTFRRRNLQRIAHRIKVSLDLVEWFDLSAFDGEEEIVHVDDHFDEVNVRIQNPTDFGKSIFLRVVTELENATEGRPNRTFFFNPIAPEMVLVGDPGNPPFRWPNGWTYGSVDYPYYIGRFSVTNLEYVQFLNSVDRDLVDEMFHLAMELHAEGGIVRVGSDNDVRFEVKDGFERKPVVFTDFYAMARYTNWLMNWASGAETDSGFYTFDGLRSIDFERSGSHTDELFQGRRWIGIVGDEEWFKAAYYEPGWEGGTDPGRSNSGQRYHFFAGAWSETPPVAEFPSSGENSSNYHPRGPGNPPDTLTKVGAYHNAHTWNRIYDLNGNVQNRVDLREIPTRGPVDPNVRNGYRGSHAWDEGAGLGIDFSHPTQFGTGVLGMSSATSTYETRGFRISSLAFDSDLNLQSEGFSPIPPIGSLAKIDNTEIKLTPAGRQSVSGRGEIYDARFGSEAIAELTEFHMEIDVPKEAVENADELMVNILSFTGVVGQFSLNGAVFPESTWVLDVTEADAPNVIHVDRTPLGNMAPNVRGHLQLTPETGFDLTIRLDTLIRGHFNRDTGFVTVDAATIDFRGLDQALRIGD